MLFRSVVAGLVLDFEGTYWLGVEWSKVLAKHSVAGPIHMREFGPDGQFRNVTHENRRALFSDLVRLINSNKLISLAATLTAEQYRRHFARVTKQSMYGACFTNLMTLVGVAMEIHGSHRWPLDYVLDDGNAYKKHIIEGSPVLLKAYPRVTRIAFESDDNVNALQAADVLSWAVRRNLSGSNFDHGFEPVKELFDEHHLNFEYKEQWMQEIVEKIRAAEATFGANSAETAKGLTKRLD